LFTVGRLQTLTSGCVSPLRGCRCKVQNAKKMGKCNADFGASFRCLSQLKTVVRQIPRGTCKTAPAPNVNFVLCRSRSLVFSQQQSYDSEEQAAFHRASTNR